MTVALVVGGVQWAQDGERTDPAEAGAARADTKGRGAGAPRPRAPLYFTPPPPDAPSRAASPRTTADEGTGRAERPQRTERAERPQRTGRVSREPAKPARPTPAEPTGPEPGRPTRPTSAAPTTPSAAGRTPSVRPAATRPAKPERPARPRTLPPSRAKTLSIRYLGIKASVMRLRLDSDRRLPAPPDDKPKLVGWYAEGPAPGGPGTAVVVGHRDTRTGPAVFAALEMIKPGRTVEVRRADGRTAVYTVDAVKTYEKARFPNKEVYGHRGRPELRLITCGGTYDRRKGYASNVVVFAHLTATR
ncbi:class F sortase [Streptomyces sp. DSM 40750]|nr:class F sortase [Streptomyces sp. DSM 40750]UUU27924.1 class F sortase [Streptomyces sp. DSM 40750]